MDKTYKTSTTIEYLEGHGKKKNNIRFHWSGASKNSIQHHENLTILYLMIVEYCRY